MKFFLIWKTLLLLVNISISQCITKTWNLIKLQQYIIILLMCNNYHNINDYVSKKMCNFTYIFLVIIVSYVRYHTSVLFLNVFFTLKFYVILF